MEPDGVVNPLSGLLRAAFAFVVLAAAFVDLWVIRRQMWIMPLASGRASFVVIVAIVAIGVAWVAWPSHVLVFATAAAALSLLQTSGASNIGLRVGVFTEFVVLPVFLAAVLSRPGRARWPVAALLVIAAESVALRAEQPSIRVVIALSMLVLLGVASAAVIYMRVRDGERRTSIERARQQERLDLARELHDIVGHHVTGIVVLAQARQFAGRSGPGSSTDRAFADIEAAGLETLASVRRLIGLLRTDPSTSASPRLADVERIVEGLRTTHPDTDLRVDDVVRAGWVPPDLANTVQRLVQEAATNVRRHGDPSAPVRFTFRSTGTAFELTAENRGLHTASGTGYGLVGMRERVDALGGTFDAGPVDGDAWMVRAVLPLWGPPA